MFHFSVLPFQKIGIAILTSFLECPMKRALRDLGNSRIYTAVSKKKHTLQNSRTKFSAFRNTALLTS